ncbi:hypothetical protein HGA64_00170 [Candidatus Falkowbacteria bacterium]|nr:hypothetical protein [Candidatus Falkowbacteria bacterium]
MSKFHVNASSLRKVLALFLVAAAVTVFVPTYKASAATGTAAPLLSVSGARLDYLGLDSYGLRNYRINVQITNRGRDFRLAAGAASPALTIIANDHSGYGMAELKDLKQLPGGATQGVVFAPVTPAEVLPMLPGIPPVAPIGPDYKGISGSSIAVPTSTPFLYLTFMVSDNANTPPDYSKKYKAMFEIKPDGKVVEVSPDFVVTGVRIVEQRTPGATAAQRYVAQVTVKNTGSAAYNEMALKYGIQPRFSETQAIPGDLTVALRVSGNNGVKNGFIGFIKGPVIAATTTQTLNFLLPAGIKSASKISVKALANFGIRYNPFTDGSVNDSVIADIDSTTAAPQDVFEKNHANNAWSGVLTLPRPDLYLSNVRLTYDQKAKKYYASVNASNKGDAVYVGSSTVKIAFRFTLYANRKNITISSTATLGSSSGYFNKGMLGTVKLDMTQAMANYPTPKSYKFIRGVAKIDANNVTNTSVSQLVEKDERNNSTSY